MNLHLLGGDVLGFIRKTQQDIFRALSNRTSWLYKAVLVLSLTTLVACAVYAAARTSTYFSTNSDAIIATQQFSHGVVGNTVALPGSHANILMIPLLYVQGHLPYHFKSFLALNILLVLSTILVWAILSIKLFGRRYEIAILLLTASLIFASTAFNIGIGNTTFRNIAFPISLWFIFIIQDVLRRTRQTRWIDYATLLVGSVLFMLVIAGDSFFLYSIVLPLLITLFWYWLQSNTVPRNTWRALMIIALVISGAWIIKWLLAFTGVIYFDHSFLNKPTVLPYEHFWPSLQVTFRQLIELQGGYIFGLSVKLQNLLAFVNLAILVIGVGGLVSILLTQHKAFRKRGTLLKGNLFVITVVAVSYFTILFEYILSGYAVAELNGKIIDFMNMRYLTLLPLATILGFVWVLHRYYREARYITIVCLITVVGILVYYPTISESYKLQEQIKPTPTKATINEIVSYLDANDINVVVTDFWYGPPIRFLTNNRIVYAPTINCNQPIPFDSRKDWFTPQRGIKTALIIDRGDLNFGYWSCSDNDLLRMYGAPISRSEVAGVGSNQTVKIWVYGYDLRERLKPFPEAK